MKFAVACLALLVVSYGTEAALKIKTKRKNFLFYFFYMLSFPLVSEMILKKCSKIYGCVCSLGVEIRVAETL